MEKILDKLNDQVWFQQIKGKWDELDPRNRVYIQLGSAAGLALIAIIFMLSWIWSVHKLKSELYEKEDLLAQIQSANDELRRLKETLPPGAVTASTATAGQDPGPALQSYFESTAQNAGIDKASLGISEKKPGKKADFSEESLYTINLKHINIKQAVRFAFQLENGNRPVKLRNLSIDTHADPEGYLDATLAISAFMVK